MNYGEFGGQYVPQELKEKLNEIEKEFTKAKNDEKFVKEYLYYLKQYVGRPTPLYYAENLSKYAGGAKIYLKREDLINVLKEIRDKCKDINELKVKNVSEKIQGRPISKVLKR